MAQPTGTRAGGKPLSYTQNLEDYHLALALGSNVGGFYIDVGGGHPIADNVSMWFYERGWSGLIVEPQAPLAALYAKVRPRDNVFEGLVGEHEGEAVLHTFPRLHGLSTTIAANAESSRIHGDQPVEVRRPMTTLAKLCETHAAGEIDFLKIDVEGAEKAVLAGNDWHRFRPKVVVAEAIDPAQNKPAYEAWEPILIEAGYLFRLDDTLNRFYVAREHPDVFERLPSERGDWGAVTHMYEIGKAPENAMHPENELAIALARGLWASLPALDPELLASLLSRGRGNADNAATVAALAKEIQSEAFRAALGRIACGYDGGQIG